jgi:hypothetical protein
MYTFSPTQPPLDVERDIRKVDVLQILVGVGVVPVVDGVLRPRLGRLELLDQMMLLLDLMVVMATSRRSNQT